LAFAKAPTGVLFRPIITGDRVMSKNKGPEKVFRVGYVSASVFVNTSKRQGNGESDEREFRTVSLQRSFKDDEGKWQYSTNLTLGDIANARRALKLAQAFVEAQEAIVVG
jgi:hypothetical protein